MQNTDFIYSAILHKMKIPIFLLVWPSDQTHYSPKSNYLEGKWIKLRTTRGWCEEKENRDNTGFFLPTLALLSIMSNSGSAVYCLSTITQHIMPITDWRCSGKTLIELHVLQVEPEELICTKCSSLPSQFLFTTFLLEKDHLLLLNHRKLIVLLFIEESLCFLFLKFLY